MTRSRVLAAAARLFADVGFPRTTVDAVAREAGVSPATVYSSYESKAGLVVALLAELEQRAGMEERVAQMLAEPDPGRCLALFVASNRAVFEGGHDVLRAAYQARGLPEVMAFLAAGDANRRVGTDTLTRRWHRAGALRPGMSAAQASQTLWLLSGVEQYLNAVDTLGWSPSRYESWLRDLLDRALLPGA